MKIYNDVDLSKYTTIKIGGNAQVLAVPASIDELIEAVSAYGTAHLLGGGSNLLITDSQINEVILLRDFNNIIEHKGNGRFYVGASVRLQKLINEVNAKGYGGIEFLYSVPGLVGGAVFMNAGSGRTGEEIGSYVISVHVLHDGKIEVLEKNNCRFGHRSSLFKGTRGYVILGVEMQFHQQDQEVSESLKRQRIEYCKKMQDTTFPNFGSVFSVSYPRIMNGLKKIHIGKKNGCHYSSISPNWIVNEGRGTFKQTMNLIRLSKMLHKIIGKPCKEEVIIWNE